MLKKFFLYLLLVFFGFGFNNNIYAEDRKSNSFIKNFLKKKSISKAVAQESSEVKNLKLSNDSIKKEDEEFEDDLGEDIKDADLSADIENKTKKEVAKEKKRKSISDYYIDKKTLMYKKENLNQLIQILDSLERGGELTEEKITKTGGLEKNVVDTTSISMYLNSILYISENIWSIWVNGQKITNFDKDENEELKILSVTPEEVSFIWSISKIKWEIINANNTVSKDSYTIEDNKIKLKFILEPNQSFVPSKNEVVEGDISVKNKEKEGFVVSDESDDEGGADKKSDAKDDGENGGNLFF
jgi:hypothetical protein